MVYYRLRSMVCGGGDSSVSLQRKKYTCIIFSSILCSYKCGLFIHAFMCWREKRPSSIELSNNIRDRREAKGTGILSDLLLGGWRCEQSERARELVANPQYTILLEPFGVSENSWYRKILCLRGLSRFFVETFFVSQYRKIS